MIASLAVRFLHMFSPETAHNLAILALRHNIVPPARRGHYPLLKTSLWGKEFKNPLGLAAGFDKDAACISGLFRQGFGFIEVGTVTLLPQAGNPKPRLFRLTEDSAIINRMGFNNKGIKGFCKRLQHYKSQHRSGIIGANIGKNKTSTDPIADYTALLRKVYDKCDYITINISSPNTPGLRALQGKEELDALLSAIMNERFMLIRHYGKTVPILVKIAPDITFFGAEDVAALALKHKVDGLIISNTTIEAREQLTSRYKDQTGGLSGKPLFPLSTQMLQNIYRMTKGKIPLIGVGGIFSGEDAYQKIRAGASLLQIYTAVIYEGFAVIETINAELAALLERDGFKTLQDAIGVDAR